MLLHRAPTYPIAYLLNPIIGLIVDEARRGARLEARKTSIAESRSLSELSRLDAKLSWEQGRCPRATGISGHLTFVALIMFCVDTLTRVLPHAAMYSDVLFPKSLPVIAGGGNN